MRLFDVIYPEGRVVSGESVLDWPLLTDGVQYVIVHEPPPEPRPNRFLTGYVARPSWRHVTIYTGVDRYDPFETGFVKHGSLLPDDEYAALWRVVERLVKPDG